MTKQLFILAYRVLFVVGTSLTIALASSDEISTGLSNKIITRRIQEMEAKINAGNIDSDDFERLNEILETVTFRIEDDMAISEKVGLINLEMVVDRLVCRDISIGNIVFDHSTGNDSSTNVIDVELDLTGVDASCDVSYRYEYGFIKGSGTAEIVTVGNAADTSMKLVTDDEDISSIKLSVTNCIVDVDVTGVNFEDADFASNLVGLFERYLRDLIEKEIEEYSCTAISTSGATFLNDEFFSMIEDTLNSYIFVKDTDYTSEDSAFENELSLFPDGYDKNQALNFQEISETQIGTLFKKGLNELDQLLGGGNIDDDELGINNFLRSSVLDKNGAMLVNVEQFVGKDGLKFELTDQFTETNISLEEVRIYGLDSMTKFNPLVVSGNYTLRNEFSWGFVHVEADIKIDIKPSSLETSILKDVGSNQTSITEQTTVKFGAENIDINASLFALISMEVLGGLTIGSVLSLTNTEDYSWLLPCLTSGIDNLQFTELRVSTQQIKEPILEGFIDDGLDRAISNIAELIFDIYGDILVEDVLPNVFQSTVKNFFNDQITTILADYKNSSTKYCPVYDETIGDDEELYVDFRKFFKGSFSTTINEYGELPSMLWSLMDKELLDADSSTGMPKINEVLIDSFTLGQSGTDGTLLFDGGGADLLNIKQNINVGGLNADIRIRAKNVKIENLDTLVSPLVLLQPVATEPYYLNNSITVGTESRPVKLSTNIAFSLVDEVGGTEISNELDISLDMHTGNVIMMAMLKISKSRLLQFPLVDVFDINCWISTIPAPMLDLQGVRVENDEAMATLVDFAASVANLNLNISCVACSSPMIVELAESLMSSGESQNDVTDLVNLLLLSITDLMKGDILQVPIDRVLSEASKKCRHSPNYDPNASQQTYTPFESPEFESSTTYLMLLGVVALGLVALVAVIVLFVRCFTQRRHKRWLSSIPTEKISALTQIQQSEDSLEMSLNSTTRSMFQSEHEIPFFVRWGMPIIVVGNIALFLSGHLSLGATVNIEAQIAGETIKVDKFFEFSMAKSTIDIWKAGGEELAILILVFSCIWPYSKQIMTLALWFAPTSWVPLSRRGSVLMWLDCMGKWSMIDIFVLIISLAAFRVSVNSPSNFTFLPDNFYSLNLLVVPLWGLYANLIAQLVSQISSHFIIHYHRKIENNARDSYDERNDIFRPQKTSEYSNKKFSLRSHLFERPHRGEAEKLKVRNWVNHALIFSVICLIICVIGGCIVPSFSVEIFGLLGVAVESGQEFKEANSNHSVFTVMKLLLEEAQFLGTIRSYVGLLSFSAIFAATVFVVPILQAIALLGQWFVPLTMKQQTKVSILLEILQAWQYSDVFLIAIFVASWQLGPISSFMVNSYCDSLDSFFSEMVFYGVLKNEDAQCFSVKSSMEEGFFVLAAGAILLAFVNTLVTKAKKQYFRDQIELQRQTNSENHSTQLEEGIDFHIDSSETTIQPISVLFTDTFRWLLRRQEEADTNSQDSGYQNVS